MFRLLRAVWSARLPDVNVANVANVANLTQQHSSDQPDNSAGQTHLKQKNVQIIFVLPKTDKANVPRLCWSTHGTKKPNLENQDKSLDESSEHQHD